MSVRRLRETLARHRRSTLGKATLRLALSLSVYAAAFYGAVAAPSIAARFAFALVAGLFSGNLFMIGHDACHGSYTPSHAWNQVLGRVAFLPSYHPYSVWEHSHNRTHHIYTNLRGRDFVWAPLTKPEFDQLSWVGRVLYRTYRTPVGLALYYPLDLWRVRLFFPRRAYLDRPRRIYTMDCLLVLGAIIAQHAIILALGARPGEAPWIGWLSAWLAGVVVPWLVFGWLIGFVVYFNHTHPRVVWFDDKDEWSFADATIRGTVHLHFPRWTRAFASNIMAHVAHHLDPRIPLARLREAQDHLESLVPGAIVVQAWSVAELCRILRVCKLYDYEAHGWTDYDGRPTTPGMLLRRSTRDAKKEAA